MARVLIADDDADVRELVAVKLAQRGYEVTAVEDGLQALQAIQAHTVDLALLNIRMSRVSGLAVCRTLRAAPETAALPILLSTARSQEGDVETAAAAGADDYITKPFNPWELSRRFEVVLARVGR